MGFKTEKKTKKTRDPPHPPSTHQLQKGLADGVIPDPPRYRIPSLLPPPLTPPIRSHTHTQTETCLSPVTPRDDKLARVLPRPCRNRSRSPRVREEGDAAIGRVPRMSR